MDTIDRGLLDFDMTRSCSVSSAVTNIYACLACGKYFQGRGRQTPVFFHAVHEDHHLYINLETEKIYCLPEGYEVVDSSTDDIKFVLNPKFTRASIQTLDTEVRRGRALDGRDVVAGTLGFTPTLTKSDGFVTVFQALAHVGLLRDFFMLPENYSSCNDPLVHEFGRLIRKLWNEKTFRHHVSPHAFLQVAALQPDRKFNAAMAEDAQEFLVWLLNSLHLGLGGTRKKNSSVIFKAFQGELEMRVEKDVALEVVHSHNRTPFLFLSLDMPTAPLFKDSLDQKVIPQVPIQQFLKRFDGETIQYIRAERRRAIITSLPPFLIFHFKRFSKNLFTEEKNPTVIAYPMRGLDLIDLVHGGVKVSTRYNLIANITHEGGPTGGTYHVHVLHKATGKWLEMSDVDVTDRLPQMMMLSDTYIQIYERDDSAPAAAAQTTAAVVEGEAMQQ
eukprot:TRINITY_DN12800_c0_g1_i1.p1 TRINITY_DN12800_c0_g1~~TRINITY_DN12800_c0_g1_i1.p1  ORF type:complete len:507 (-),score=109.21 TRINITY_DN12800_c0_g1_i1:23-1354(-)